MKLLLCFTLLIVTFLALQSTVDAGLIRRSRRLRRIGPHRPSHGIGERSRSSRVLQRRKWPHFLAPPRKWGRNLRRPKPPQSIEREDRPMHHMRLPLMAQPSTQISSWRPLDFGNPIDRDPTFDYAPPALERVRFKATNENRRRKKPTYRRSENGKPRPSMFGRPRPRPSIWKLLATKQRSRPYSRRPPVPHHPHMKYPNPLSTPSNSDEAEIFPRIPNIVYFRPKDVIPGSPKPFIPQHQIHQLNTILNSNNNNKNNNRPPLYLVPTFKPGHVTSVPLYSRENTSPALFNPIAPTPQQQQHQQQLKAQVQQMQQQQQQQSASTPQYVVVPKQPADILYRPQEFMNPTRKPTILQPMKSTPITYSATRNSVIKPVEPTESLLNTDLQKPINSFSILNSVYASNSNSNKKNNYILNNNNDDKEKDLSDTRKVIVKTEKPRPVFESSVSPVVNIPVEEESTTLPISILTSVSSSTSVRIRGDVSSTSSTTTETSISEKSKSSSSNRFSSTLKPIPTTSTTTPETTTTTIKSTTTTILPYQKLPQMPKYTRPSPTYPKRITTLNKSPFGSSFNSNVGTSSSSKETGGSGEGLVITMARSKVKEYKPQFLANYTQLLTFDKVQELEPSENDTENEPITTSSLIVNSENLSPSEKTVSSTETKDSSSSTTKSPLQNFDPLKLLHSWFQNT